MSSPTLRIGLYRKEHAPHHVVIRSQRPVHASRVLENRNVCEARRLVGQLFSMCRVAQSIAADEAIRQAQGRPTCRDAVARQELALETAKEHLWRILVDWAAHLGEEPKLDELRLSRLQNVTSADMLEVVLSELVFGMNSEDWLAMDSVDAIVAWAERTPTVAARMIRSLHQRNWCAVGSCRVPFLPDTPARDWQSRLSSPSADAFIERPVWNKRPRETTPLSRNQDAAPVRAAQEMYGRGLLARQVALLAELANTPSLFAARSDDDAVKAEPLPGSTGISQVDAARGRLVHRVVLKGDRVSRWQIIAPTEWNFHPSGVLAKSLAVIPNGDSSEMTEQANLLVRAVDPCVDFKVEVH